jgi:hypothetical protein
LGLAQLWRQVVQRRLCSHTPDQHHAVLYRPCPRRTGCRFPYLSDGGEGSSVRLPTAPLLKSRSTNHS